MKYIKLTQGYKAKVDDEDYELVNRHKWFAHKTRGGIIYVEATLGRSSGTNMLMHRFIFGRISSTMEIDHVNKNPLDNRKSNLRAVSRSTNLFNRKRFKNKAKHIKYVGVYETKNKKNKWLAVASINNEKHTLGTFKTQKEASTARNDFINNIINKKNK